MTAASGLAASKQERVGKWRARAVEWDRLAEQSMIPHVADMCRRFAESSRQMADFHDGGK